MKNKELKDGEIGSIICAGLIVIALMYWIAAIA